MAEDEAAGDTQGHHKGELLGNPAPLVEVHEWPQAGPWYSRGAVGDSPVEAMDSERAGTQSGDPDPLVLVQVLIRVTEEELGENQEKKIWGRMEGS